MKSLLCWLILTIAFPPLIENPVFKITERSRAHHPGEVLRITLSTSSQFSDVSIEGWGRKFPAFKQKDEDWLALVGIDLGAKPGDYQLKIQGVSQAGPNYSQTLDLKVEVKEFPTRRLTVDPKFVSPPQDQLARIQRESRWLSSIFSKVSSRPHWSDSFLSPVPGAATSGFGKRSIFNGQPRSPHSGTDFDAESGTPVASPNAGEVILAQDLYYTGKTVVIDHGLGLYSLFAHLSAYAVEGGDKLSRNELVGQVGATGRVTGPHLHWTVRLRTAKVDPLSLIEVTRLPSESHP